MELIHRYLNEEHHLYVDNWYNYKSSSFWTLTSMAGQTRSSYAFSSIHSMEYTNLNKIDRQTGVEIQ